MDFKPLVKEHKDLICRIRQDLHRIPELGHREHKTARYLADFLSREGYPVRTGVGGTGVVATLQSASEGATVLIRADMDALPISEDTGLAFASGHPGVMHACGHDAHMAMALGAAKAIRGIRDRLRGTVKFVFQPAEETAGGAKSMIDAGVLEDPRVDCCFGCHVWPGLPEGTIGVKAGPLMASMTRFEIKIIGKGGHGAMPHLCVDSLEVATQVVNALQRIASRQMNPMNPTVVTIGKFIAGTAFNIIPPEAELAGTTRTFDRTVWAQWPERLEKIVRGVCDSMGAAYEFRFDAGCPPLVNDSELSDLAGRCAAAVVGKDRVIEPERTMGGEDMAFFHEAVKGCYYFIGVGRGGAAPVHNPRFDFNPDVLTVGVETYCRILWEKLGKR
jgi:amidohydrolase